MILGWIIAGIVVYVLIGVLWGLVRYKMMVRSLTRPQPIQQPTPRSLLLEMSLVWYFILFRRLWS